MRGENSTGRGKAVVNSSLTEMGRGAFGSSAISQLRRCQGSIETVREKQYKNVENRRERYFVSESKKKFPEIREKNGSRGVRGPHSSWRKS